MRWPGGFSEIELTSHDLSDGPDKLMGKNDTKSGRWNFTIEAILNS